MNWSGRVSANGVITENCGVRNFCALPPTISGVQCSGAVTRAGSKAAIDCGWFTAV
ncbi:hypothetical protein ACFQ1I_22700 [Kitasatospora arboriphila]